MRMLHDRKPHRTLDPSVRPLPHPAGRLERRRAPNGRFRGNASRTVESFRDVDAVPETRNASVRWLVETVAFHVHRSASAGSVGSPLAMFAHLRDGRGALKHAALFLVEAGDATHGCAVVDGDRPAACFVDLNRQAELALSRLARVSSLVPSVDLLSG